MTVMRINHDIVSRGNAHHKRLADAPDEDTTTLGGGGRGLDIANEGGASDMTTPIVALSAADITVSAVTVRALAVCVLAAFALFVAGGRIDWTALRDGFGGGRRTRPIYLRVDQQPTPEYKQPDIRRRLLSSGELAGLAVVSGVVITIAISIVLATVVGSVTNLLR